MTPTDEQVERVAKAINGPHDPTHIGPEKLKQLQDHRWQNQTSKSERCMRMNEARAAIAAMQPTVAQAAEVLLTPDDKGNRTAVYSACEGNCKVYRFDAALRALTEQEGEGA